MGSVSLVSRAGEIVAATAVESCVRRKLRNEGPPIHCDAVNRGDKFVHRRDHGHLRTLARRAKTLVIGAESWIHTDGNHDWPPEPRRRRALTSGISTFPESLRFPD